MCEYTKTVAGHCNQQALRNNDVCYYHNKVREGLIETDEMAAIYDLPTIVTGI